VKLGSGTIVAVQKLRELLENNRRWAERMTEREPQFFAELVAQQTPRYLWIGCSDSRVPANEIVDLRPGELFVHRNVANLVSQTDLNCLSVLQYAIDVLRVDHVIVCGHYGCGGVRSVLAGGRLGLVDQWLQPIRDIRDTHKDALDALDDAARSDRLCELNVREQVRQVGLTMALRDAWQRGQRVAVHGWIYGLHDGRIRDLDVSIDSSSPAYAALATSTGSRASEST
jgi:carbonic anhydrase